MSEEERRSPPGPSEFLKSAQGVMAGLMLLLLAGVGNTTLSNSRLLVQLATQIEFLVKIQDKAVIDGDRDIVRIEERVATIWPRLRELKERLQHLESVSKDNRAGEPWRY